LALGVARRVGAIFIEPQLHRFQVARQMRTRRCGMVEHEAFGQ
jgi:hypothetical protein